MKASEIGSLNSKSIAVAIGSGGIYSVTGLGVLKRLEKEGLHPDYVGGASGGAIIAALYFLEAHAKMVEDKLLEKLPKYQHIKFSLRGKPIRGLEVRRIIKDLLDGRDWKDGKLAGLCLGAAYCDNGEPVILTRESGLPLVDCVLASASLRLIEPVVSLGGRLIAHGGDPYYLEGLRNIGSDFIIEVSLGKAASIVNEINNMLVLKHQYLASRKKRKEKPKADFVIHFNPSLRPLVSPLDFSVSNARHLIKKGEILAESVITDLKQSLARI